MERRLISRRMWWRIGKWSSSTSDTASASSSRVSVSSSATTCEPSGSRANRASAAHAGARPHPPDADAAPERGERALDDEVHRAHRLALAEDDGSRREEPLGGGVGDHRHVASRAARTAWGRA